MKLHKIGRVYYVYDDKLHRFTSVFQAMKYMLHNGVSSDDLLYALQLFESKKHNYADFGIVGKLTFTSEENPEKLLLYQRDKK